MSKQEKLKHLINEARENHLWLHSNVILVSPDELEEKIKLSSFCSFVFEEMDWELINPFDKIDELIKQKTKLNEEIINLRSRIEKL